MNDGILRVQVKSTGHIDIAAISPAFAHDLAAGHDYLLSMDVTSAQGVYFGKVELNIDDQQGFWHGTGLWSGACRPYATPQLRFKPDRNINAQKSRSHISLYQSAGNVTVEIANIQLIDKNTGDQLLLWDLYGTDGSQYLLGDAKIIKP